MSKKFTFLILIILMASIGVVSANDNETTFESHDLVKYYKNDTQFEVNVHDSNASVNFNLNGNNYTRISDLSGIAKLNINLAPGNYSIITQYKNVSVKNNITVLNVLFTDDLVKYYKNDSQFFINLLDASGNPLNNNNVTMNINGVFYTRTTNASGIAKLNINLAPGNYIITTSYNALSRSNNVTVLDVLFGHDLVKYYKNNSQYYFRLLDGNGQPLADTNVTLNINGVFYIRTTNSSGIGKLNINLVPGNYIITASHDNLFMSNNIMVISYLKGQDLTKIYLSQTPYLIKVLDNKLGNPVAYVNVTMNINGVFYTRTTNASGIASLNINLEPNEYIITSTYDDLSVSNLIKVFERFSANDITTSYGNSVDFSATFLDDDASPIANEYVTFMVGGVEYSNLTDNSGVASVKLNYPAGNYVIESYVGDFSLKNSYVVKNSYSINMYSWNSGADITQNSVIKSYIPNDELISRIISAAKSGTPMIKFKGGEGKSVFITAGVHGNELSSQVAAMRLITYLKDNPIDGTVYIMPFVQPKATAANIRNYNGVNLNSVANLAGTISNNIVNLVINNKCDAYGDFHCTMPGGDPGKNVAMGTYSPTAESATIAKYISSKTGFSSLIYNIAGSEYPGALEDVVNLKGIPSVTCEVLTPHGTIASGSVDKSLAMMKVFLQYNGII